MKNQNDKKRISANSVGTPEREIKHTRGSDFTLDKREE